MYEPWLQDKRAFLEHVVSLEGWDNPDLEMDRIDVDKGYEPGNIRFISRQENMLNKRSVQKMQARIHELEARVRHLEQWTKKLLYDSL